MGGVVLSLYSVILSRKVDGYVYLFSGKFDCL